jgi:glutamine amidotransferase
MDVVIIDYGAGNIKSLEFVLQRLGLKALLSRDETTIRNADKVIFPGVGEASSAMLKLKASGLDKLIPVLEQPILGICLGMQLMCNSSEENNTEGLGIFDVDVLRFSSKVKVPQIGWNEVFDLKSGLFDGISENEFLYSVHSFYAPVCEEMIATTHYELNYAAALQKDNFYGVQFHPEKSSTAGQRILQNFLDL